MPRPNFIEIPPNDSRASSSLSKHSHLSPRIQHFDGDVPPALSPLDAIAARSRRLAKELEETRKAGERRMSRLPPQVVTESLTEHQNTRPPIFRALSDGLDVVPPLPTIEKDGRSGSFPKLATPLDRPTSQHVRMSAIIKQEEARRSKENIHHGDYFGAPRVDSPTPLERPRPLSSQILGSPSSNPELISRQLSDKFQADRHPSLAPPRSHSDRLRPYQDGSDDDYTSSTAGSTFSPSRKPSSSSGVSAPQSPVSTYAYSHGRSPSNLSLGSPTRSHFTPNFSRPLSSSSMSNLQAGQSPSKGPWSAQMSHLRTASSFDESRPSQGYISGEASSYTHATYSLPRGRKISDRHSGVFSGLSKPHFEWQEPIFPGTPPMEGKTSSELAVPSPMASARPSREDQHQERSGFSFDNDAERTLVAPPGSSHPSTSYPTADSLRSNDLSIQRPSTREAPSAATIMPPPVPLSPVEEAASHSSRSNSTVRPTTARTVSNYQALSAEEHVTKAIGLHEHGDLKESTYHLRIAAKKGHPTGMLLYALACRHGWGMRANQKEGVQWLRKAVDSAILEIADDENPANRKPGTDFHDMKTHRAQFALSIYELGVSHLNGWGIEQDKALALRCFEVAANWGDVDALTEAGFCYAEGVGCKKDLKKAAKFYRLAEAQGVSMVGNSWIHKEKYNDLPDEEDVSRSRSSRKTVSEKPRSKSKSRSIFGRKKLVAA